MVEQLRPRQRDILEFIGQFLDDNGLSSHSSGHPERLQHLVHKRC